MKIEENKKRGNSYHLYGTNVPSLMVCDSQEEVNVQWENYEQYLNEVQWFDRIQGGV